MLLYGQEPMKISYQPARFGDHRHYGSEDIMVLVCHVILLDFLNQEYQFTTPKSRVRQAEKQEKEEHR